MTINFEPNIKHKTKRSSKIKRVKKAKSFVHCTLYGFVYDEKIIKPEWVK